MVNIALVDDDVDVRESMKEMLDTESYTVFEAVNGIEGVRILKENKIDLIVLDVMMPEKGGIDTLLEIHNMKDLQKIIVTGYVKEDAEAFIRLAERFGVKKILYKPFKRQEFLEAIENALQ